MEGMMRHVIVLSATVALSTCFAASVHAQYYTDFSCKGVQLEAARNRMEKLGGAKNTYAPVMQKIEQAFHDGNAEAQRAEKDLNGRLDQIGGDKSPKAVADRIRQDRDLDDKMAKL